MFERSGPASWDVRENSPHPDQKVRSDSMELKRQACQAASDQPACEVVGGKMVGRGLPRPWSEGDEPGRCPWWRAPFSARSALWTKRRGGVLEGSLILLGINCLRMSNCDLADRNFSTTELTTSPNNPVWEMGASRRKTISFSRISVRFSHKWLSADTEPAMERPTALAVCLVALRAKSVA